jgi:hypothetical protein
LGFSRFGGGNDQVNEKPARGEQQVAVLFQAVADHLSEPIFAHAGIPATQIMDNFTHVHAPPRGFERDITDDGQAHASLLLQADP